MTDDRRYLALIESVSGFEEKTKLFRLALIALLLLSVLSLLLGLCNTTDIRDLEESLEETREYVHSLGEQKQNPETGGKIVAKPTIPPEKVWDSLSSPTFFSFLSALI